MSDTMTTSAGPRPFCFAKRIRRGFTHTYGYDDLYRVETAAHPDSPDEGYTYDEVGNRLSSTPSLDPSPQKWEGKPQKNSSPLSGRGQPRQGGAGGEGENTWLYNDANQLLDDGRYTYRYDANGNMSLKTLKANPDRRIRYTYNSENQLIRIDSWDGTYAEYAYDGLGRRIQKSVVSGLSSVVRYVYDNEDIIAEYSEDNVLQATYLHGPGIDEPVHMERGGEKYYYHADGLGSITELTDSTGTVVQTYTYDAFGKIVEQTPARRSFSEGGGSLTNPYTYTGREFDEESGLYFYRARYLDPLIGRFLQEDPVAGFLYHPKTLHKYFYALNNPVNWRDPYGRDIGIPPWAPPILPSINPPGRDYLIQRREIIEQGLERISARLNELNFMLRQGLCPHPLIFREMSQLREQQMELERELWMILDFLHSTDGGGI